MTWYLVQIGRALSRLFNAITGGEGDTTTSAYVYKLHLSNRSKLLIPGTTWVLLIDTILRDPDHCLDSYLWHKKRGLFENDING